MTARHQRGVALISVLLLTSLVLLVTAGLLRSHRLAVQGITGHVQPLPLRQAALMAESRAAQWLQDIDPLHSAVIHPGQAWARQPAPLQLSGLELGLSIEDLGGRFNLSALAGPGEVDPIIAQRWSRLLASLDITPFDLAFLDGASLTDTAQLNRVPALHGERLQRLLPWVAVLPRGTALNVNTAPAQVLACLENMTLAHAHTVFGQRPAQGYPDIEAFIRAPAVQGLGVSSHGLGVGSQYMRVTIDVSRADTRLRLVSDLQRVANTRRMRVIQRRLVAPTESLYP
ncbi:general secretion pathway protein GspK [Pseudomonas syringae]|nr:general secretion pathway protein GspK [Pseudomonas syringae]MBD8788535.1 general secretion pathway protein GspK [Pseudomonas syringae]MBD8801593.1 general secretion pathway protein GspK [Pseudomonas syringae]MBD8811462.1 general secretion pathway protein GspK [Pseudomonas syringae]